MHGETCPYFEKLGSVLNMVNIPGPVHDTSLIEKFRFSVYSVDTRRGHFHLFSLYRHNKGF